MTLKQAPNSLYAPDGSYYVTITDGAGSLGSLSVGNISLTAGSAKIGVVTTDQTTHGTTDLVAADITKVAGASIATGHGTASGAIRVELPTDSTGIVNLASGSVVGLSTGSNTIGSIQGITTKVGVTPTVTASTYAVSKVMGGIITFANILPGTPFGGVLESITIKFKASIQTVGFWVSIFDTSPAGTFTDTNTAAIASADTNLLLGSYHLTSPCSMLGTHTIYNLDGIGKAITGQSANLYVVVVPDATTAALASTTDMIVTLGTLWG